MQRATLIINPRAGRKKDLALLIPTLSRSLEQRGIVSCVVETRCAGDAQRLAHEAAQQGIEAVFACGGDGTVHEVLQGVVGTSLAMGILPLGTANALARNLGLSLDPATALIQQLDFEPRSISVGEIRFSTAAGGEDRRFFTVMAGAGPDGALVYSLLAGQKCRLGRTAYYAHAARLFITQRFNPFTVTYRLQNSNEWREQRAVSAMCVRVANLGGLFDRLTPGASIFHESLRLVLVKPPAGLGLLLWFAMSAVGLHWHNPFVESFTVAEFGLEGDEVHAQADGEWLGRLPVSVCVKQSAVSILMPRKFSLTQD